MANQTHLLPERIQVQIVQSQFTDRLQSMTKWWSVKGVLEPLAVTAQSWRYFDSQTRTVLLIIVFFKKKTFLYIYIFKKTAYYFRDREFPASFSHIVAQFDSFWSGQQKVKKNQHFCSQFIIVNYFLNLDNFRYNDWFGNLKIQRVFLTFY